ncbi:hypothetical protein COY90_02295 [Candidatus Roizmanbacteria bacterium CG_4_10_14_0_8_um_filter_39_9]|uniref:dTDP-4-dehydrorhamnose reductase n=1 Tax=Candidatus Roizmanbacteria bacterium CG_4_10_14_0_8_um_filter_39_9 TaxID=1974829 RepID=A0A2M7QD38_9BACT|nr:MAG: hypothetical protein COY90_02295 [Candidatus Roizmanbacteria bacterium CG_4_10_14_0_8_um_filter_39_9]
MLKVALTGASGLVGSRIVELLNQKINFISVPQNKLDITNANAVSRKIDQIDFDIFLHLAAYTNVIGAEKDRELAFQVNRDGTKNLFEAVNAKNKKFIYISTDFVFDGTTPPYNETSLPHPEAVYAQSKYAGEQLLRDKVIIVRIAYPYRARFDAKRDFFRTFKMFLEEHRPLSMISDSLMTPTFIDDIAYALDYLFHNYKPGIYHLVGSQAISPYGAVMLVAKIFNLKTDLVTKITYEEYVKTRARLPQFADIRSIHNNFYKMKSFEEGLKEIKHQLEV